MVIEDLQQAHEGLQRRENMKKNPDYTASAINLCNPNEVKLALIELYTAQANLVMLESKVRDLIPKELRDEVEAIRKDVTGLNQSVREAIEEHGSFQDVENGNYALQQLKKSSVYHVDPFKEHFSKHTGSVVEETINRKALEGLVKGGLIEQADLEGFKVVTYDETRAFIIK